MALSLDDYKSNVEIAWCPGCGNFGILQAVKQALLELELPPHKALICSGIGQAPKLPHYMRVNTFNGLHGREIASATAAKLAADDLKVIVHSGDGGAYGEGANHLIHAIRRNIGITVVVHDNKTYGLTKGQASPTAEEGTITTLQPKGVTARSLNPLALAISLSCSFVAQGYSAKTEHLVKILKKAIEHRGFSLVNVLQPCVTWDQVHTYKYYEEHCMELGDDYNSSDRSTALNLVHDQTDWMPLGVIYQEKRVPYCEMILEGVKHPLRDRWVDPNVVKWLYPKFR